MSNQPKDGRMTKEESERYGRQIDARNAEFEKVQRIEEEPILAVEAQSTPLSDEEIKRRVGEQNFKNMKDGKSMSSINS